MMSGFDGRTIVKATFDEAADILGQAVNTQPIMLAAGVATYRAYLEAGGKTPAAVAGHSLGEYTALVAADALSFADAVRLVRLRAELMQAAVPQGSGAMAAVLGLEDEQVKALCAAAAQGEVVEAVNFNSPAQVVIAGHAAAVERAMNAAKEAGAKRALPLPVSVPSHCSLMKPAAEKLAEALQSVKIDRPKIRVIHNADVASYDDAEKIKDALVRQLYSPVRWTETVNALVSDGLTESAECGPGKVLAGLAKRINKEAVCTALTNIEQVTAFVETH